MNFARIPNKLIKRIKAGTKVTNHGLPHAKIIENDILNSTLTISRMEDGKMSDEVWKYSDLCTTTVCNKHLLKKIGVWY